MGHLGNRRWLRRWDTLFASGDHVIVSQDDRRAASSFIRFHLRDERTSPMRKFKMPIAKTNVRRAVHDECQDRCEARYREPGITCRPSDRVLNPFA